MKLNPKKCVFEVPARNVWDLSFLNGASKQTRRNQGNTRHACTEECTRCPETVGLPCIFRLDPGAYGRKKSTILPTLEEDTTFTWKSACQGL